MAEVSIRLALRGQKDVSGGLRQTGDDLDQVGTKASRAGSLASAALGKLGGLASTVSRGVRNVGIGMAAAGTGAAVLGIKTAAGMEQANIAFTTMLGSGEKAQGFLGDLSTFAAKTPFDFPGLTTAASSLISAGFDASKVIPIMTSLGNATSGMGTGAEGIQRATIALQQMSAAGKITGEDLNQLRDAGIPVFDLLSAATGKSKEEVAGLAQAGKLGKTEMEALFSALETGKGLERFNGLMEKQSASLTGMAATLKDTASMGLASAFEPAIPFLKQLLTDGNTLLTRMLPGITTGVGKVTAAVAGAYNILVHGDFQGSWFSQLGVAEDSGVVDFLFRLREGAISAWDSLSGTAAGVDWGNVWQQVTTTFTTVRSALSGIDWATLGGGLSSFGRELGNSGAAAQVLGGGAQVLGGVLQFLADNMNTIVKYMPLIVAGFIAWKIAQQGKLALDIASVPLRAAEIVSTFALARANSALAFQLGILTGRQRASFMMRMQENAALAVATVKYLAHAAATGVQTVATGAASLATRAFGAALRFAMGPVGWVITGITLLVGALVWFFTKTETGKRAWNWLTEAFKSGIGWIKAVAIPLFKVGLAVAMDVILDKFDAVKEKIGGFVDKIKDAWNWVKKLADRISESALGQAIGGFTSAASTVFGGGRAAGGPVSSRRTYLVGEQGPELFSPNSSGSILPHSDTVRAFASVNANPVNLSKDTGLSAADVAAMRRPIEIPVVLNNREIARAVYDDAKAQMRRG